MAGAPPVPEILWTVNCLMRKANDLAKSAAMLFAAAPHSPDPVGFSAAAGIAKQEAAACSAKAHALMAVPLAKYKFPGDTTLKMLTADCVALEQAIATSAGWTALIAAGNALVKTMPASTV